MSAQEEFLRQRGFHVERSDVYPVLYDEEEYRRALTAIWNFKIDGWWHYKTKYIQYEICTGENFDQALQST